MKIKNYLTQNLWWYFYSIGFCMMAFALIFIFVWLMWAHSTYDGFSDVPSGWREGSGWYNVILAWTTFKMVAYSGLSGLILLMVGGIKGNLFD